MQAKEGSTLQAEMKSTSFFHEAVLIISFSLFREIT
jgi:hypothetical protein